MKLAVVKPDHLGDLVLSQPAIEALRRLAPGLVLFVNRRATGLARHLFPDLDVRPYDLPHLLKDRAPGLDTTAARQALANFELVVFLRDDPMIREIARGLSARTIVPEGDAWWHETQIQRAAVAGVVTYRRSELFPARVPAWPSSVASVGVCIAAGFPTNRWPELFWVNLGRGLQGAGKQVHVVCGPAEVDEAGVIARQLGLKSDCLIVGGPDFATFLSAVERCDAVIAVDGGTAHLCSLVRPVLSIFGSSPWRRYSPFGRFNRTVSLDLFCSPCLQFSRSELNGCLSRECMANLTPDLILQALELPDADGSVPLPRGRCWFGVSHLAAGEDFRMLTD
jgi:ADP-heptose:LPS heptosyltransferase